MIPQAAPQLRFQRFGAEITAALREVLDGSHLILGPKVAAFEAAFAGWLGRAHCVGVNSGTDAIALGLRALGVRPGDHVITTALTAAATAQAIVHCGAVPIFADVDPRTGCLDPAAVEAAISSRTTAIVAVHLYGFPAPVDQLRAIADRHSLLLLEDCAQAHGTELNGRRVGGFGHAAAFSFYPTKNLGALGDAGAVATDDAAVAEKLQALRAYGWDGPDRISREIGFNSRLDEVQAAVLLVMLGHLAQGNAERRAHARLFLQRLEALPIDLPPWNDGAIYHQFVIRHPRRDAIATRLRAAGVGTAVHYTPALHQQPAFAAGAVGPLPETERLAAEVLSLPIQPELVSIHADAIVGGLTEALSHG